MDAYKTHGAFSWNELTTPDPAAAAQFYGQLFGWTSQDMGAEMDHYLSVNLGETAVGGIMSPPPGTEGMPPHWGAYVTVDNVDQVLEKAAALGGKVLVPPLDVPGIGRMAVMQDPQGAVLSLITYALA